MRIPAQIEILELSVARSSFKLMGQVHTDFPALPDPKGQNFITIPGHAGAAILHHFVKGDRVLSSMLVDFNGPEVEGLVGSQPGRR